jgi:hypothetical protein
MVAPEPLAAKAIVVNQSWIQLYLPEKAYDAAQVEGTSAYTITSDDDPAFSGGVKPALVQRRHFPESAPYSDDKTFGDPMKITVVYRVYLKMPKPLKEGKTYKVTAAEGVKIGGPFSVTWSPTEANEAIHVNQVAYLADGPKIAYLSAWTGKGTVDFGEASAFEVIDEATNKSVLSGNVHLDVTADKEPWSKSNVYSLDFSSLEAEGTYHLYVPTVGASYPFRISKAAFNDIGYTLLRGLTMQRDGDHGLDEPNMSHWVRPPAHLDDAIVESTGQWADLSGGHMDAGDRGKYPHNMADVSGSMLSTMRLFPEEVEKLGESLQIPESGNGVPDFIDEAVYELDFLYKVVMNTPKDGAVPFYLRPQNKDGQGGYEDGEPLEGKPKRKLYDETQGPNRSETLYTAGVLAMAYNTPIMQKYVPAKCADYLAAAERAYNAFKVHNTEGTFFKEKGWYDPWKGGPTPWADEMLVAASNLLEATGDAAYVAPLKAALPADLKKVKLWSWALTGPWLTAYVSLYKSTSTKLSDEIPGIKERAEEAIIHWGDETMGHDGKPYAAPFGAPLPSMVMNEVGWYFSGDQTAFPAMVAYGVTKDVKYRDVLIKTWSYLLGANPLSRTFISGLGQPQRSPRWTVHEIAHYQWQAYKAGSPDGWSEIVPGIPSADLQTGGFDAYIDQPYNVERKNKKFPAAGEYAALYRYHDSWTVKNEFTIDRLTRGAVSVIPLVAAAATGPSSDPNDPNGSPSGDPGTGPGAGSESGGQAESGAAPGASKGSGALGCSVSERPSSEGGFGALGWLAGASLLALMSQRKRARRRGE